MFESVNPTQQFKDKWALRDNSKDWVAVRDADMAMGVAPGYVNVLATMLGYGTGCCVRFDWYASPKN